MIILNSIFLAIILFLMDSSSEEFTKKFVTLFDLYLNKSGKISAAYKKEFLK